MGLLSSSTLCLRLCVDQTVPTSVNDQSIDWLVSLDVNPLSCVGHWWLQKIRCFKTIFYRPELKVSEFYILTQEGSIKIKKIKHLMFSRWRSINRDEVDEDKLRWNIIKQLWLLIIDVLSCPVSLQQIVNLPPAQTTARCESGTSCAATRRESSEVQAAASLINNHYSPRSTSSYMDWFHILSHQYQ